jgi:hypothetical protein
MRTVLVVDNEDGNDENERLPPDAVVENGQKTECKEEEEQLPSRHDVRRRG